MDVIGVRYLVSGRLVCGHVTVQLSTVAESFSAQRAGEALLVLLVTVLDVFLQRRQALVAAVAVWTREQLGEVILRVGSKVCRSEVRKETMSLTLYLDRKVT